MVLVGRFIEFSFFENKLKLPLGRWSMIIFWELKSTRPLWSQRNKQPKLITATSFPFVLVYFAAISHLTWGSCYQSFRRETETIVSNSETKFRYKLIRNRWKLLKMKLSKRIWNSNCHKYLYVNSILIHINNVWGANNRSSRRADKRKNKLTMFEEFLLKFQ